MLFSPHGYSRIGLCLLGVIVVGIGALWTGGVTAEQAGGARFRFVSQESGDKPPLPDKHTKADPIKANGSIFVDWPQPDATLVFTGAQDGYLEPCGCAGLTNQKGGLKRRHTFLKGLAEKGWNPVPLDTGGQIKRFGQQAQIKLRRSLESLVELGYQGIGFGSNDLRQDLLGILINFDEQKNPMTSANVGLFDFDETFSRRWRVVEAGGLKIGFTSVLGEKEVKELGNLNDVNLLGPEEALRASRSGVSQAEL